MMKAVLAAAVMLPAAGCGSGGSASSPATLKAIAWDDRGRAAKAAALGAYLNARMAAKASTIAKLRDLAQQEGQGEGTTLIKAWCAQHHGG